MTRKEREMVEVLLVKMEALQEDVSEVKKLLPKVIERVTALERIVMFFKGATAVIVAGASYLVSHLPWGG